MASSNAINLSHDIVSNGFVQAPYFGRQREKISCSIPGISAVDPSDLVGLKVSVDEFVPGCDEQPAEIVSYSGVVVGFICASRAHGFDSKLHIEQCAGQYSDPVSLSYLTVTAVESL